MRLARILVPTDFSTPSERALEQAVVFARKFDARLTLLHVWSLPYTAYSEGLSWPVEPMERAAQTALDEAQAKAKQLYPRTDAILRQGAEWAQIIEVIAEQDIDLVVMGTHGRRGLAHVFMGSVAERVVRMSPVPVMTVGGGGEAERSS